MPRQQNHAVRKHFTYNAVDDRNLCNVKNCFRTVKGNHAGNLLKHILIYHREEYNILTKNNNIRKHPDPSYHYQEKETSTNKQCECVLTKLAEYNPEFIRCNISSDVVKNACIEMVTVNGRPLEAVEDSGFRKILDPILNVINSSSASTTPKLTINKKNIETFITEEADAMKMQIRQEIKNKMVSLKLDCATRLKRCILGVNIQFIYDSKIVVRTLAMIEYSEKHTAEYICGIIMEILKKFEIQIENIYTITTDNGANMLKTTQEFAELENTEESSKDISVPNCLDMYDFTTDAESENDNNIQIVDEIVENMKLYRNDTNFVYMLCMRCPAHTLDLVVNDSLKSEDQCLSTIRTFVKKLRNPTIANLLRQQELLIPPLDCATRWSSTYNMIETLLRFKNWYLNVVDTESYDFYSQSIHWEKAKEILDALAPAAYATNKFQTQQLTITDFYAEWLKCKLATSKLRTPFGQTVYRNIIKREKIILDNIIIKSAIYLDPRFQATLSEESRFEAKFHLKKLWITIKNTSKNFSEAPEIAFIKTEVSIESWSIDEFEEFINEISAKNSSVKNNTNIDGVNIANVLERFNNIPRINHTASILEYWNTKKFEYPELFELSQIVFGVPATQISVERAFSSLQFILSSLLENLNDEILENILLVRLNKIF